MIFWKLLCFSICDINNLYFKGSVVDLVHPTHIHNYNSAADCLQPKNEQNIEPAPKAIISCVESVFAPLPAT